jgi:hypothetical protein
MNTQFTLKKITMIVQETLTALFNNFLKGLTIYAIGISLAYAGDIGQTYNDWCDPTYCCNPKSVNE